MHRASAAALRHEGGGGGVGDSGGAPRWALLPSGLGRLGPDVIEVFESHIRYLSPASGI